MMKKFDNYVTHGPFGWRNLLTGCIYGFVAFAVIILCLYIAGSVP